METLSDQQFQWVFQQVLQVNHEFSAVHTIHDTVVDGQAKGHDWADLDFTVDDNWCLNSCCHTKDG